MRLSGTLVEIATKTEVVLDIFILCTPKFKECSFAIFHACRVNH
jgi:hypothetical protein